MNAFQLIDALSASFFGLLGIWAAVVRRHWFVRMAIVGGVLLIALFIPAYEVVIEFAVQMAIIALVIRLARGERPGPPKFSMETLLLAMVAAVVVAAVAASAPSLTWLEWSRLIGIGAVTAYAALLCLWIVGGAKPLKVRLPWGLAGVALLAVALHAGQALDYAATAARYSGRWREALSSYYDWEYVPSWMAWTMPTLVLGLATMVVMISLGRSSGWFSERRWVGVATATPRRQRFAQVLLCLLFLIVTAPLLAVFMALVNPSPLPETALPVDNGYDDIVTAGRLAPANMLVIARNLDSMSALELRDFYTQLGPLADRAQRGVRKECRVNRLPIGATADLHQHEEELVAQTLLGLSVRYRCLRRFGTLQDLIESSLLQIEMIQETTRGGGISTWELYPEIAWLSSIHALLDLTDSSSLATCRLVSRKLIELERTREAFADRRKIQQIIDENSGWESHAEKLFTEWSGNDPYAEAFELDLSTIAAMRLVAVDAALQEYFLEHGRRPDSLSTLTNDYLDDVPLDPYDGKPLRYLGAGRNYKLYSVGADGEDDGGVWRADGSGDVVLTGPHQKPYWRRVTEGMLGRTRKWLSKAGLEPLNSQRSPVVTDPPRLDNER